MLMVYKNAHELNDSLIKYQWNSKGKGNVECKI